MSTVLSTDLIVPLAVALITGFALFKKVDVFAAFIKGAKDGLSSAASILPALCFLMTAIGMLRQSGAIEFFTGFISPFAEKIGFPAEIIPLALLRPFSGSGAIAYYEELCQNLLPGSFPEKVASVLMGGSETTFYTVAVLVFNAKHHLAVYFLDDSYLHRIYVNGLLIFFDKIRSNGVFLAQHSHFYKLLTTVIYKFNKFLGGFNPFGKSEIVIIKLKYFHFILSSFQFYPANTLVKPFKFFYKLITKYPRFFSPRMR